jgi:dipeptidyl aminopeptidase/acylaminoacyl peptidase
MLILAAAVAQASLHPPLDAYEPEADRGWIALSPDGDHLAWAEWEGEERDVVRIVVADAQERRLAALDVTDASPWVRWAGDRVVFAQREPGRHATKAWRWSLGDVEDLAPGASSRLIHEDDSGRIVLGVEERRGREHLELVADGERVVLGPAREAGSWILGSEDLAPVGRFDVEYWGAWPWGARLYALGEPDRLLEEWDNTWGYPHDDNHWLARQIAWGGRAVLVDGHDRPADAVVRVELATGAEEVLFQSDGPDVADVLLDAKTGNLLAVAVTDERVEWTPLDASLRPHFERLSSVGVDFTITAATPRRWMLAAWSSTMPRHQLLYDLDTGEIRRVGAHLGVVESRAWRPAEAIELAASDGLPLTAYFTSPDPERFGEGPWPTVVNVHGGPWPARDSWALDPEAQRMADLGYATLKVNFRGSDGFGREWQERWRGEWGRKMQTDLLDGLDHVVVLGLADPDRVAFLGGSYGGYAVLRAATTTPERMKCAAALAAPALLAVRHPLDAPFYWSLGPRRERMEVSPVRHVADLGVPLLLEQGGEDTAVRPANVRPFVRRARRLGKPVTYVFWDDEGHGFEDAAFLAHETVLEAFLAQCLGGEAGPIELGANDVRVPLGAELVPGLQEALDARP